MGRGRQKAKHQKVARELKYHSTSIDVSALERELAGGGDKADRGSSDRADDDQYADGYYGDDYEGSGYASR